MQGNLYQPWSVDKKKVLYLMSPMGAYDGAEVCELVGICLLSQLSSKYKKENIGLYLDDGLAIFKNISGPQSEKLKKQFQQVLMKIIWK